MNVLSDVVNIAMDEGSHVMLYARSIAQLTLGMLLSVAGFAEEATPVMPENQWVLDIAFYLEEEPAESDYSALLETRFPVELTPSTVDWPENIAELDFQDTSIYGRMSELRNLSLLTLAEFGQRRLFLGVNDSGLIGLHFGSFSGEKDQQYLEVVRLSYLDESELDGASSESESQLPLP